MNIEQGFIRLLGFRNLLSAKQEQVSKSEEGNQIKQITHLQDNGGFKPSFVKPERPENKNRNHKQYSITYQEKGLKNTVEEITHCNTDLVNTKLQKNG